MTRQIILYSKPGCHLCEDVLADLQELAQRFDVEVIEIDINADPSLFDRYRHSIPVVDFGDGVILPAPVTRAQLLQAMGQFPEKQ